MVTLFLDHIVVFLLHRVYSTYIHYFKDILIIYEVTELFALVVLSAEGQLTLSKTIERVLDADFSLPYG